MSAKYQWYQCLHGFQIKECFIKSLLTDQKRRGTSVLLFVGITVVSEDFALRN